MGKCSELLVHWFTCSLVHWSFMVYLLAAFVIYDYAAFTNDTNEQRQSPGS
jgi:hypothetical protein